MKPVKNEISRWMGDSAITQELRRVHHEKGVSHYLSHIGGWVLIVGF
jgi:hypothetical protein